MAAKKDGRQVLKCDDSEKQQINLSATLILFHRTVQISEETGGREKDQVFRRMRLFVKMNKSVDSANGVQYNGV